MLGALACLLAVVASFAGLGDDALSPANGTGQMIQLETRRASSGDYLQIGRLISRVIYRGASVQDLTIPKVDKNFVELEISSLMKEFGAEEYSVPPEFVGAVNRFVSQYQDRDRDLMVRALAGESADLKQVRLILRKEHLPEDLLYMALVESGFLRSSSSHEGAVGFWQFTEATAREYGMEVNEGVDERLDLSKSTHAACRYLRDLILDFGAGSSVMLAMAAYNSGPDTVRRAVRNVEDPILERNFWHLYRTQALPAETLQYVPKVIAAMVISRNPERFGF